jgi:hypothetical protein
MIKRKNGDLYCPNTGNTYRWMLVGIWNAWGYTRTERLVRVK